MPSLQTALPPELANNAIRLYRECLRRAKYIGHKVCTFCYISQSMHTIQTSILVDGFMFRLKFWIVGLYFF
ncbi:hypothetical protein Hdeb2414_s0133g00807571 [Helianthus debilis subsp. tardiflorus]